METTETKTQEIQLVQVPKIVHRLQEVGKGVTTRLAELNLESLVATEETVKSLKELRAELNKELTDYEGQRKWVKEGVLNPYNEFEAIYKTEISEKYKAAIDTLKTKIEAVESKIKAEKRDRVKIYFDELCVAEGIDFIPFEKAVPDINLSTTEKKYKDQCNEFIAKVKDELTLIASEEFQAEILTEYKKSLNSAQAITAVRQRKEAEKAEAERIKTAERNNRIRRALAIGLNFDSFTKTYIYNDAIYMTEDSLDLSKEEFEKQLASLSALIAEDKAMQIPEPSQGKMEFHAPAPVSAPEINKPEEKLVKASFEVTGTMAQLKALGQYMRENKITYKNI